MMPLVVRDNISSIPKSKPSTTECSREVFDRLLTPRGVLEQRDFPRPFVIRPIEFPSFEKLLEHRDEIRDLKLVPVKDEVTHVIYNNQKKEDLLKDVLDWMRDSKTLIMPNQFPYWLSDDVNQSLLWVKEGATDDDVFEFLRDCAYHFQLDLDRVIMFERPLNVTSTLVKGTFPQMRHIHLWRKK
jgi:hypothetical protein